MKAIRIRVATLFNAGCSALIGMLGFSAVSCDDKQEVMYGTPYVKFELKGTVSNEEGEPIENATVEFSENHPLQAEIPTEESPFILASGVTNAEGRYQIGSSVIFGLPSLKIVCRADDYETAETTITPGQPIKSKKDDAWCEGTIKEEVNFTLKKK